MAGTKDKAQKASDNRRADRQGERERQNGSKGHTGDENTLQGLRLRVLKLQPKSALEVYVNTHTESERDWFGLVDTEDKQLSLIEDLYAILIAQKAIKFNEPKWSEYTEPFAIIRWLCRKLAKLAKGEYWFIDTYMEGKKTRYEFVIMKWYSHQYVDATDKHVPLDFLPYLKKRDEPLHDCIIDMIAFASRTCKIPLWDEDGDYSEGLAALNADFKTEDFGILGRLPIIDFDFMPDAIERQRLIYRKGLAAQYMKLIKQRRKLVTRQDVWDKAMKCNWKSDRLLYIKNWIINGMELCSQGGDIKKYTRLNNYRKEDDSKLRTPYRRYKFTWAWSPNDFIAKYVDEKLGEYYRSSNYHSVMHTSAKPGQKLKPLVIEKYGQSFPEKLDRWMHSGLSIFCGGHHKYYYGKLFDKNLSPTEKLMQLIDEGKIKMTL